MKRRIIYALLSGLLFALSWPTYGFPFLLFIAFVPLLLIEHEINLSKEKYKFWKVFGLSYLTFFIWNYASTQWLHFAQRPDGSNAWEAFLFPLITNSLFMSITFSVYHVVKNKMGTIYGLFFFPMIWILFEKLHLEWEISWPWLNLGNAFSEAYKFIQWYEFTGTFGGTLWVICVNILFFYNIRAFLVTGNKIYLWNPVFYSLFIIGIPVAISLLMYRSYEEKSEKELEVVLIQPFLNSYTEKYTKNGDEILSDILTTADPLVTQNTSFVVSPETSFPGRGSISINYLESDNYIEKIHEWLKAKDKVSFVSGVSLVEFFDKQKTHTASYNERYDKWMDYYNSAIQINKVEKEKIYHKGKLVLGVEMFPYSSVLKPIIGNIMLNFGGTISSLGSQKERDVFTNSYNEAKIAPIICYESVYGEYVTEYVKKGANVLFIMTNDSWWQNSQGHKQLLSYARLRAIETRRDIARSANTGTSAFINQRGDIVNSLKYDTKGALKGNINLNNEITYYVKSGDFISRFSLFLSGILLGYAIIKNILKRFERKPKKINFKK